MDELKMLIEMVNSLPALAIWVLVGFYAYKVVVIGSIYGVIRLAIVKMHDWLTRPPQPRSEEVRPLIDGLCITGCKDELMLELRRLRGKGLSVGLDYIHGSSVAWLRAAIDDKIEKDSQAERQKRKPIETKEAA